MLISFLVCAAKDLHIDSVCIVLRSRNLITLLKLYSNIEGFFILPRLLRSPQILIAELWLLDLVFELFCVIHIMSDNPMQFN